jgi:hypothetical protein
MEVTVTVPDDFAARVQRCGTSPQDYIRLLLSEAMRMGSERERKSRPADARKFLEEAAAEAEIEIQAEELEMEAELLEAEKAEHARRKAASDLAAAASAPPISASAEGH